MSDLPQPEAESPLVWVYEMTAPPGAVCWDARDLDVAALEERWLFADWEPVPLDLTVDASSLPTFSWVGGLPFGFVISAADEQASFFAMEAGQVLDLIGDASGYQLVIPDVTRALDGPATAALETDGEQERWAFRGRSLDETIFRTTPRSDRLFCAELEDDDPVEDLEDYANMGFYRWYALSGATGVSLRSIWEGPRYA